MSHLMSQNLPITSQNCWSLKRRKFIASVLFYISKPQILKKKTENNRNDMQTGSYTVVSMLDVWLIHEPNMAHETAHGSVQESGHVPKSTDH